MSAYYAFLPILVLLALIEAYIPSRARVALTLLLAVALGAFAGLRLTGIDNDSITYSSVFDYVSNADFGALLDERRDTSQEPGYLLYLKTLYNLGFTYPATQFLLNVGSVVILGRLLERTSRRPILGLLLYYSLFYYFRDFTQIRFGFASVLSLWALYFWFVEGQITLSLCIASIALSFHNSTAIIIMPVLFSYFRVHERYLPMFMIAVAAIVLSFVKVTTTILVNIFSLPEQILRYLDLEDGTRGGMASIALGLIIALLVIADGREDRGRQFIFYTLFSSFVAGLVFSDLSILLRMQLLLFTAIIIAPTYLRDLYGKALLVVVCCGALYIHMNNINEDLLRPYQTWLVQ